MMEQELKPYPEYKEIGLPWLKNIPSHWSVMRNKNVLVEKKTIVGENSTDFKLLSLTKQGVIYRDLENAKGKFPKEFSTYKIVEKNNLILCLFDLDETPRTVGISSNLGMITGAYDVFRGLDTNMHYAYYYYLSIDNIKGLKPLYTGLRKVVKMPVFLSTKLPIPPRPEQDQIVKYLDFKLLKINKFIKDKKREIELLKELKQAEINRAVTKGLNPNVPMKDSGIDWLGEIPEHWEVKRVKNVLIETGERSIHGDEEPLSMSQKLGLVKSSELDIPNEASSYIGGKIVHVTDLVFNKLKAHLGVFSVSKYDGVVSPDYAVYSVFYQDNVEYLERLFKTKMYIQQFIRHSRGVAAGFRRLYTNDLFNIKIALPKPPEQHQIYNYIINLEVKINKAISAIESEISLIQEYKTSIISDVVTGKVDVRDVNIEDTFDMEILEEVEDETEEVIEE